MRADFEAYLSEQYQEEPFTLKMLLEMEDEAGIEKAVVMADLRKGGQLAFSPDNEGLAPQIQGNPRTIGCAVLNPHLGRKGVEELKRAVTEWGFQGLKLMPSAHKFEIDDEIVDPFVETARDLGIVVSIHSGIGNSHPTRIGRLAGRYPEVSIIMDHMGFPEHVQEAIQVAEEHPTIHLGTTILRFFRPAETAVPEEVREAVTRLGPERVVFGSNLPEFRPIQVMQAIQRLELGPEAERMIFGDNLARVYGLES